MTENFPGYPSDPMTVEVRIVNGVFLPCKNCHWFNECVVPTGNYFRKSESSAVRPYYKCLDYVPNIRV